MEKPIGNATEHQAVINMAIFLHKDVSFSIFYLSER
jgi:hypothetical protein